MPAPLTAVLFGAGNRGYLSYAPYALQHPEELQFVAVAEPNPTRRERFAAQHQIPPQRQFASWQSLLAEGRLADVCLNTTQDREHRRSTVAALAAGYDVLLEKPIASSLQACVEVIQAAERSGRILQVCHVLRYAPFFMKLHEILRSGRLGDIMTVEHRENVAYWHMAHSFVRGHWRNAALSSPMLLAKCCHDLDILAWNLGSRVARIQSFGSLRHFRAEQAPLGAPARCTDGCPASEECPFDARRIYLNPEDSGPFISALGEDLSPQGRRHALESGPFGRCVYRCDNDAVDQQTVNMEFESGASVVLFMHGHAHEESRTMRYDGSRATLRGKFTERGGWIEIHDHVTSRSETLHVPPASSGHGGGDLGMVRAFLASVRTGSADGMSARESLESHLMAFAAEESRGRGALVDMAEFRAWAERAPGAQLAGSVDYGDV